jgi:hypothetical protein
LLLATHATSVFDSPPGFVVTTRSTVREELNGARQRVAAQQARIDHLSARAGLL